MRRALFILFLCLAAATSAAAASPRAKGKLTIAAPGAPALDLRGAVKPDPAIEGAADLAVAEAKRAFSPAPVAAPSAPALASNAPPPDGARCRASCARDYYFCLAREETSDCAPSWGRCRSGCDFSPGLSFGR